MAQQLKNKNVVITGGAEGLGFAIADKFLENEAKLVIILDINQSKGEEAVKKLNSKYGNKSVFVKCDVTKDLEEVFKSIVDEYKTIDVLVNNAGVVDEISAKRALGINLVSLVEWSMKFYEYMRIDKGGKGGTIINMSSLYGFLVDPFLPFYKASKYGVLGFTRSLGHKLNFDKFGVRVIAVCPGFTETYLTENLAVQDMTLDVREEFKEMRKQAQWQKPDAVGRATVEVFQMAPSGTVWMINGNGAAIEVPGFDSSNMVV